MALPNTFIIGVQKAGTTTLHDWLVQHPQICGKNELKDFNFFKGDIQTAKESLLKEFKFHKDEPVILQSCVNYFLYPHALKGIFSLAPDARLIVILRNPVSRAFSAYEYFKKLQVEKRSLKEALVYEPQSGLQFSRFNNDFTYIEHGLYYKQLTECFRIFSPQQVLILDFEDLKKQPENVLNKVYNFLNISSDFMPKLDAKNVTGSVRSSTIQNILTHSKGLKYLVKFTAGLGFSPRKRKLIKQKLIDINTSKRPMLKEENSETDKNWVSSRLVELFLPDVKQLDSLLGTDFLVKWFRDK